MNKKILITGASGHLGGMLFKLMPEIGYRNLVGTDLKKKKYKKTRKIYYSQP
jgi:dTDP-4-dehydrorhamnose reductase